MGGLFIDPGRLSARLDLETPPETDDGQGGVLEVLVDAAELADRLPEAQYTQASLSPAPYRESSKQRAASGSSSHTEVGKW